MTYLHDLSPFLWQISGEFGLRWYGLSYVVGFVVSFFFIRWLARRQQVNFSTELISDFVTTAAIGAVVGGRLGYCLFYSPDLFLKFKSELPFWGVLAVNEGGMSSHGGMIGLVLACIHFSWRTGISRLYLFDIVAICGPIGLFFGRLANFVNGELVGRPGNWPFGVKFPQDIFTWPAEQFSRLTELATVIEKVPGQSREAWLQAVANYPSSGEARTQVYQGLQSIVSSVQQGVLPVREAIAPLLVERFPSQLIAAFGEGLIIFIILLIAWRTPRKPGVIGSLFLCLYGITRIITEEFRMPDPGIGYQLFDLTRGQWLSIGMLVIGLVLITLWGRRISLPVAGWGSNSSLRIHRR